LSNISCSFSQESQERKKKRKKEKARKILRIVANGRHRDVVFTDEKIFTVEQAHNHQNDRQLLPKGVCKLLWTLAHVLKLFSAPDVVTRSHFPKSVMVWAGITATSKTPLVFVDRNVKINAAVYQQLILRDTLDPWAKKHFKNRPWTL